MGGIVLGVACSAERDGPVVPVVSVTAAPVNVREIDGGASPGSPARVRPVAWRTDLDAARRDARRESRRVLVYVHADWSATAVAFDRDVWTDDRVRRSVALLIAVRIDASDDAHLNRAVALGVDAVPAVVLLGSDGSVLARREGLASADTIRLWLKRYD